MNSLDRLFAEVFTAQGPDDDWPAAGRGLGELRSSGDATVLRAQTHASVTGGGPRALPVK